MTKKTSDVSGPMIITGDHKYYDDDCACPDSAVILRRVQYKETNQLGFHKHPVSAFQENPNTERCYQPTPGIYIKQLKRDFHLIFSPFAPSGPSVINKKALTRFRTFSTPQPLIEPIDHAFADKLILIPENTQPALQNDQPETLTTWLHITNACNLQCAYCYVNKSGSHMSQETGFHAVKRIFETAKIKGFSRVKLKYAGGEPMLNFPLVKRLSTEAKSLSDKMDIGLLETILSNGTCITEDDAIWSKKHKIKIMISMDWISEHHNQLRPCLNGSSSFHKVKHTIDKVLIPLNIKPRISATITRRNMTTIADTVRWVLSRDLPMSLNFVREASSKGSKSDLTLETEAIIRGMCSAYDIFEEFLPEQPFLNGLLDRVQANTHLNTCGVGLSYLVINHEGKLAQCQMHLDRPVSDTLDGNLITKVAKGPIRNLPVFQKNECADCLLRFRCTGGCPLESYRVTGQWDGANPNCEIYQALYPKALRLEGLRLLKNHGYH